MRAIRATAADNGCQGVGILGLLFAEREDQIMTAENGTKAAASN